MSDTTAGDRTSGDFERYGLLAALTLVVLCLLLADRIRTARPAVSAPAPDRTLRVEIGGYDSTPRPVRSPVTARPVTPRPGAQQQPAAPVPAPAPTPVAARTCVVGSGETLGDIAQRELGSARRAREIAELNGLANVNQIRAGQSLRLPPR